MPAALLHEELGVEQVRRLEDMGVIVLKGGSYRLRPWARRLIGFAKDRKDRPRL